MEAATVALPTPARRAAGLYTVIAIKLGKGLLLLAVALGIFSLLGDDLSGEFEKLLRWLRQDPEHEFWNMAAAKVGALTPGVLTSLASGTLLYAVLLFVESLGLFWRSGWAAWLAIGETGFFIPIEVFDLLRDFRLGIAALLVVNALIVGYLVRNRSGCSDTTEGGWFRQAMRASALRSNPGGLTMVELLAIVAVITVLAFMLLPGLIRRPQRPRFQCANNLKQIGLSFGLFALDNQSRFPMAVSTNEGGAREFGPDLVAIFGSLSNELSIPKIIVCPADRRHYASNFAGLQRPDQISYFLNHDASAGGSTNQWLAGDRNLTANGKPAGPGLLRVHAKTDLSWGPEMHGRQGFVAFVDGRAVAGFANGAAPRLPNAVRFAKLPRPAQTNCLIIP